MTSFNKPKPIIQKIVFSKEETEEIKTILAGRPDKYTKGRAPSSAQNKIKIVKQKYYKSGFCCLCAKLPEYRAIYKMDGASLIENYCSKHLPKEHKSQIPT